MIGTGSTPLSQIAPIKSRDYFYDGPLQDLAANNITREISPIASAELAAVVGTGAPLNEIQMETVRGLAKNASALGIETRFWGLPGWPVKTRNTVWSQLVDQVFLLNVDDLQAAAEGDW